MKKTISNRITLLLVIFVIAVVLISSFISNGIIDQKFKIYLKQQHEENINKVIRIIEKYYYTDKNDLRKFNNELNGLAEVEELFIEIKDLNENVVYSSGQEFIVIKKHRRNMMGEQMKESMDLNSSEYIESSYDITSEGRKVASLTIGYFGSFNMTNEDLIFKRAMNISFVISAIIVLILTIIVSFLISKKISKPLVSLTNTANEIKRGNYNIRSGIKTKTKEIDDLSFSINYLAESLHQQEGLRKRLTSDLVHEIKTPLTILNNFIDAFLDGVWEPDSEKLESCKEEILRLSKMVDNLKNIYLLEESKLNLSKAEFNLSKFLSKIINTFTPIYQKKNIQISHSIVDNIIVFMDMDKIKQIIYNLLSNAYRYTDADGQVKVSLEKNKSNIIIKVMDNGIGIEKEDIINIFERFYRTDLSRARETGGAGIGLTIVKTLTEAHEGEIYVESELGKGSTFILTFPIEK